MGGLKCDQPDCKYKGTFKRGADLLRHERLKHGHGETRMYPCPAEDCRRRLNGFTREDKLRDHIRAAHRGDSLFECLERGCERSQLTMSELQIHIKRHEGLSVPSKALYHTRLVRCPIEGCLWSRFTKERWSRYAQIDLDSIVKHLKLMHQSGELLGFAPSLRSCGIDANTLQPCCPICGFGFGYNTYSDKAEHLLAKHSASNVPHINAWLKDFRRPHDNSPILSLDSFDRSRFWLLSASERQETTTCTYCTLTLRRADLQAHKDHFKDMIDMDFLENYRFELFDILPGFEWNPVFDYLDPKAETSGTESSSRLMMD